MKTIIRKQYFDKNNTLVCMIDESNISHVYKSNKLYDSKNNLIYDGEYYYIYNSDNLNIYKIYKCYYNSLRITECSYDECNTLIKEYNYYMDNTKNDYYIIYKYNTKGKLKEKVYYIRKSEMWPLNDAYTEEDDDDFVLQYSMIYKYDKKDRLISIVDRYPDSKEEYILYHEYEYDENDNIIYFYDHYNENKEFYKYDEKRRVIYRKYADANDVNEFSVYKYEYDENDNIIKKTEEDNINPENNIEIIYENYPISEIPEEIKIEYNI